MISRDNNFDILRLIAAIEVAVGHIFIHLGIGSDRFVHPFPGVLVFFVISGFLISSSIDNSKSFLPYLRNRLLRIVPALWISFVLVVFVLMCFGFINIYVIRKASFWIWCVGQITIFQFFTPDFFRDFGVGCPNGSLWTIPVEFLFYILLPLIIYSFKKYKNIILLVLFIISALFNFYLSRLDASDIVVKLFKVSVFNWLYVFLIGSIAYYNWNKLRLYIEGKAVIYMLIYVFYVNCIASPSYTVNSIETLFANLLLGVLTLSLAYTLPKISSLLKGFDLSYGLYVYHMIIVNIFVQIGLMCEIEYAIIALIISIIMGALSWHFVERKILRYKKR